MSETTPMEVDNLVVTDPKPPSDIGEQPKLTENVGTEENKSSEITPQQDGPETQVATPENKDDSAKPVEQAETKPTQPGMAVETQVETKDATEKAAVETDSEQITSQTVTTEASKTASQEAQEVSTPQTAANVAEPEAVADTAQPLQAPEKVNAPVEKATEAVTIQEAVAKAATETNQQPATEASKAEEQSQQIFQAAKTSVESEVQLTEGFHMEVSQSAADVQQQEVKEEPAEPAPKSGESPEMVMFNPDMEVESSSANLNSLGMESGLVYGMAPPGGNVVYQESHAKNQTSLSQGLKMAAASKGITNRPENIILPTKKKVCQI